MNRMKTVPEDDTSHLHRRHYEKLPTRPIKYTSAQHAPKNYSTAPPALKREYRAYTAEPKNYRTYYVPVVTKQYVSTGTMLNVRNEMNPPYAYQPKQYCGYAVPHKETLPVRAGDINNHHLMYFKNTKTVNNKNHVKQYVPNSGDYIREQQYYKFNKYNPQIDSNETTYFLPDKEPLYVNPAINYKNSNDSSNYYQDCQSVDFHTKSVDYKNRPKNTVYYPAYVPPVLNEYRKYSDYSTATSYEKEPPQRILSDANGSKIVFTNPKHNSIDAMADIAVANSDVSTVYNVANSEQVFKQFNRSKPEMVSTETATQTCDISYLKSLLGIKTSSATLTDQATQTVFNKNEKERKQLRCSSRQTQTSNPVEEAVQKHINFKNPKNLKESVIRWISGTLITYFWDMFNNPLLGSTQFYLPNRRLMTKTSKKSTELLDTSLEKNRSQNSSNSHHHSRHMRKDKNHKT